MRDVSFSFTIQGDAEGYVTFECPFCRSEFKLKASEVQSDDNPVLELFCPYCGLVSDFTNFYSEEVVEKAHAIAENYMIEQLNNVFGQASRKINNSGKGIIKMEFKPLKKVYVKEIREQDTAEVVFNCSCCNNTEKVLYCSGMSKIFCSYCGVDIV